MASHLVVAGAGFLLAVIWFDLMFDVQVRRRGDGAAIASIAAYYRRVTTAARPMNRLVGAVMAATLGASGWQLVGGGAPTWVAASVLALVATAVLLAVARTYPDAVELARGDEPAAAREQLAYSIYRDHLACLTLIAVALTLTLVFAT